MCCCRSYWPISVSAIQTSISAKSRLLGSRNATREDFETVLGAMRSGAVPIEALASHGGALDDAPELIPLWSQTGSRGHQGHPGGLMGSGGGSVLAAAKPKPGSSSARVPGPALPIDEVLEPLRAALRQAPSAVLVAPPGAGKTTRVPLALLDEAWTEGGKLILLEPRRLAARAAAERMAATLGERVGDTVGLRARFDTARIGPNPDRGGHRGRVHPHGARRSQSRRRRGRAVRRVPRALARCRPRARAGARRGRRAARPTCASWSCRRRSMAPGLRGCSRARR